MRAGNVSVSPVSADGRYYDGVSSAGVPVRVTVSAEGSVSVSGLPDGDLTIPRAQYRYEIEGEGAPLRLRTTAQHLIEIPYDAPMHSLLVARSSPIARQLWFAESRLSSVLGLTAAAVLFSWCLYVYGLPIGAKALRPFVPNAVKATVGKATLALLEKVSFEPTKLPASRQRALAARVSNLAKSTDLKVPLVTSTHAWTMNGKPVLNAMALLPHYVIITDALAEKLNQREIDAVLAHELGHLELDHGTEVLVRGSIASVATLLLFGSDPGTLQALALAAAEAQYSQSHEREADTFAMSLLCKLGRDPKDLADALRKLSEGEKESATDKYFASHPLTSERIESLSKGCGAR